MKLVRMLLCVALVSPAFAADPVADWLRLGLIDKDQNVQVHLWNGLVRRGTIQQLDDNSLTLLEDTAAVRVKREDISKVSLKSHARGAAWGFLTGLGLAVPVSVAATKAMYTSPKAADYGDGVAVCGLIMSGIGAGIGAAIGKEQVIYKADRTSRPGK